MKVNIEQLEEIVEQIKNSTIEDEIIINNLNSEIESLRTIILRNKLIEEEKSLRKPMGLMRGIILKYCKSINKCVLNKDEQYKLQQKLYYCNERTGISLINALKITELSYKYIANNTEWKDVVIFPDNEVKDLYEAGVINENDVILSFDIKNRKLLINKNKLDK